MSSHSGYANVEMQPYPSNQAQYAHLQYHNNHANMHYNISPATSTQHLQPPTHDASNHQSSGDQSAKWQPGLRRFPLMAGLALLAALLCIIVTLYILLNSDGQPIDTWGFGIAPAVYLAIASVIANVLLTFALANGLVITFWRTALHGASFRELSQSWACGSSVKHAIFSGFRRGGRLTALACIFTVIGTLRGPLNQRASSVQPNVQYPTQGNMQLNVAKDLPDGFTGLNFRDNIRNSRLTARLTPVFNSVMQEHASQSNITLEHPSCGVSCTVTVKGFGFKTSCYTTHQTLSSSKGITEETFTSSTTIAPMSSEMADPVAWNDTGLILNATYLIGSRSETTNVTATVLEFRSHICNATAGIRTYNIALQNGTAKMLDLTQSDSFEKIKLVSPSNDRINSTIGGFQFAMSYLYDSTATLRFTGVINAVRLDGALSSRMFMENNKTREGFNFYNDPMEIMISTLHELGFRAAIRAGRDNATTTNAQQTVPFTGFNTHTIYRTNRTFMTAAAAVSVLSLIFVASTFWGWWELGRDMSFNPLEIAKAFHSPLLANAGSNIPADKMSKAVLATQVRYGSASKEDKLGMWPDAGEPRRGHLYS